MLLELLDRQPQSIGVTSNFAVHRDPIWCAPSSLILYMARLSRCVKKVS